MDFLASVVIILLVLDPFGNLPMISSIVSRFPKEKQRSVIIRENLIALAILIGCIFLGQPLLDFLGLSSSTIRISGGFILLIIGIGMLFPSKSVLSGPHDDPEDDPFIVPIATPLIAGPSGITVVILLAKQYHDQLLLVTGAAVTAWSLSFIIILFTPILMKICGKRGMRALERLMGMILLLISTQMLLDGIAVYIQQLSETSI